MGGKNKGIKQKLIFCLSSPEAVNCVRFCYEIWESPHQNLSAFWRWVTIRHRLSQLLKYHQGWNMPESNFCILTRLNFSWIKQYWFIMGTKNFSTNLSILFLFFFHMKLNFILTQNVQLLECVTHFHISQFSLITHICTYAYIYSYVYSQFWTYFHTHKKKSKSKNQKIRLFFSSSRLIWL